MEKFSLVLAAVAVLLSAAPACAQQQPDDPNAMNREITA